MRLFSGLALVVVGRQVTASRSSSLAGVAQHHGLRVGQLRVAFDREHQQAAGRRPKERMVRVDEAARRCPAFVAFTRISTGRRRRLAGVRAPAAPCLLDLFDRAEEEHPVPDDRAAHRAAVLLAAERTLSGPRPRGEVVLRAQLAIALVARNPMPCNSLVPDLVTIVSAAPAPRPSAALNWLVASWNCSRPSAV